MGVFEPGESVSDLMKQAIAILAVFLLVFAPQLGAAPDEDEPLVRVNGHVITAAELDRYLRLVGAATQQAADATPMSAPEREALQAERKKAALKELVETRLLCDLARAEYLDDESAQEALDRVAEDLLRNLEERAGSRLKARQLLAECGLTVEEYKELQCRNWLAAKLLWDKVLSHLHVAPAEVRRYYEEHREDFKVPKTVVYRQILFVVCDEADSAAQRQTAEEVLAQIRNGADFAEAADRYSADRDRCPGGLHQVRVPDELSDWLPPAVDGLAPGDVTGVREVAGGFAIVRLEKVAPSHIPPFEEVHGGIKTRLLARRRAIARAAYVEKARREARLEYYPAAAKLGLP